MKSKILIIYTGGTIGMMQDSKGVLKPVDFKKIEQFVPELNKIDAALTTLSFKNPIDSSNMNIDIWKQLVNIIEINYAQYDGFVILHGSDTMAYTASALSFMIQHLQKPIVFTGSQLPIGIIRTDGKENLITAIQIAASKQNGKPIVPEVCIYFEYKLLRGNRSLKYNASHFDAFKSPNYPILAEAGVNIEYNKNAIQKLSTKKTAFNYNLTNEVAVLYLYPSISQEYVSSILNSKAKVIIMLTFGSGNTTTNDEFISSLKNAVKNKKQIVNITQCIKGNVEQGKYETSAQFNKIGIIAGNDITLEAAITKSMYLLGNGGIQKFTEKFQKNISGEIS